MRILDNVKNVKINRQMVWSGIGLVASVMGFIAGHKNDAYKREAMTNEVAKEAANIVLKQLLSEKD